MKKFFFMILVVFGFCSCANDESETTGSIYGVVTVKETAEPMRATGVELYHYGSLLLKTVTYDDGHYEFENLSTGEYELKVVASGYVDASYSVIVESGRTARADMQLERLNTHMTVRTLAVTPLSYESVKFNGEYTSDGALYMANEAGFVYSQSQSDIINGNRLTGTWNNHWTSGRGNFYIEAKNLTAGIWYVQAYTINKYGTQYGEIQSFEISGQPSVTTLDATNVAETTATLNGRIDYEGDPAYTERGFVYSLSYPNPTVDDPVTATTKVVVSGTSKEFSANIANLTKNSIHYVRAYVINNVGTVYGDAIEFSNCDYFILSSDGIMVQKYDISSGATWDDADNLCKASKVGGYSDWRLPTIGECKAIYTNKKKLNIVDDYYWTSEKGPYSKDYYYYRFSHGTYNYDYSSTTYRVRCVRTLK